MKKICFDVPDVLANYIEKGIEDNSLLCLALLMLPFIKSCELSYGRVAELLGIKKQELLRIYGELGIPYIDMTEKEWNKELETVALLAGGTNG